MSRYKKKYIRFLGNRMMLEIILNRQLTPDEQLRLFNISSKKLEQEIFEKETSFVFDELVLSGRITG